MTVVVETFDWRLALVLVALVLLIGKALMLRLERRIRRRARR